MSELVNDKIEQLAARARREIDSGLLPSCQYALAVDGEIVAGETLGDATDDTRYVIFSATKAVVVSTFWTLMQDGDVDITLPVQHYIPEFMADGDPDHGATITVEQVMLHTSGFPTAPMGPPAWSTREGRIERMRRWRTNWEPGTRFEYHPTSAHWVLGEIIERVVGRDYREVVTDRILDPLGLERLRVGVPVEQQGDVAELIAVGELPTPDELEAAFGVRELPATEVTEDALLGFNDPATKALGVPGGGGISNAADLARFYQALLHDPKGLWDPELLADVTGNVRNRLPDPMFGVPILRTLGLVTAGDDGKATYRGFGATGSPHRFGHNGAGGQLAWADPETGISFVYLTNGIDAHPIRQAKRGVALSSIAAECATA